MKIVTQINKVKCDMAGCKNIATFSIISDKATCPKEYLNLCDDCAKELNEILKKNFTPQCVETIFAKNFKKGMVKNDKI